MHNGEYYDNLMAYSYDDYVEPKEDDTEDYLIDRSVEEHILENYEYESKMAEQMIDNLYSAEK